MDWCLDAANPQLLAVGQSTGRVMLTSIVDEPTDKLRKEFTPRQSRTCNTVVWNPVLKNVFAAGLDKVRLLTRFEEVRTHTTDQMTMVFFQTFQVRSDFSCLVWDINQGGSTQAGVSVNEPVYVQTVI